MKLRILGRGLQPRLADADSLVVFADDGVTPLALCVRHLGDAHFVACCDDPRFNAILRNMGVDAVAVVAGEAPTLDSVPLLEGVVRRR